MCVSQINYLVLQVAECQFVSSATSLQRFPMLVLVLGCCNVFTTLTQCCLSNIYGCCNVATTLFPDVRSGPRSLQRCYNVSTTLLPDVSSGPRLLQRCYNVNATFVCNVVTTSLFYVVAPFICNQKITLVQRQGATLLQRCCNVVLAGTQWFFFSLFK